MSDNPPLHQKTPLHLVREPTAPRRRRKCDRDVTLHLTDELYEDLVGLAKADRRTVGEYLRVVLERHVYGVLGPQRG